MPNSRPSQTRRVPVRRGFLVTLALATAAAAAWEVSPTAIAMLNSTATIEPQAATARAQPASQPRQIWESIKVRSGDTLARILTSRGHDAATVHEVVESGAGGKALAALKAGSTLRIRTDHTGNLSEISYAPDVYRVATVQRSNDGAFRSDVTEKPTITTTRFAEGKIESSLFAAGKQAGISNTVIIDMADVFGYDIDFALEVQDGDTFRVMYEEILVDGEKVRDGKVLAAEFVNKGQIYRAIRYQSANGRAGYYTPEGMAMRKAFLRTPVDFARISSGFSTARLHPVLHTLRAHKGVDYAAARGTPIKATADGKIEYAGNKGGYGRVVILQHGGSQSTLYAHLNGFAKGIRNGARVSQGQVIGYVGSTGLASGPHLHYEFRVNGVHVNPLKVKTTQAEPIASSERASFMNEASRLLAMMDNYSGKTAVAQASTPTTGSHSRQL